MSSSDAPPNRQSHRHRNHDYTTAGAYFVTICVRLGRPLLGAIRDGRMILNAAGEAVQSCWEALPARFPTIALDEFQVMPNHVHGIVWLQADPSVATSAAPTEENAPHAEDSPANEQTAVVLKPTLGQVMRTWKSTSAIAANGALNRSGPLWLRDYWDRIIRNEQELANIRNYIRTNPQRWREDQLHPDAPSNKWNRRWAT